MAASWDESYLDVADFDTDAVVRIQAICRGWLVRKELKVAQTDFLRIIDELDGPTVDVDWTGGTLPIPVIRRASKKPRSYKRLQPVSESHQNKENGDVLNNMAGRFCPAEVHNTVVEENVQCLRTENDNESQEILSHAKQDSVKIQAHQEVQTELPQTVSQKHLPEGSQVVIQNSDSPKIEDGVALDVKVTHSTQDGLQSGIYQTNQVVEQNCRISCTDTEEDGIREQHKQNDNAHSNNASAGCTEIRGTTSLPSSSSATLGLASENSEKLHRVDSFFGDQTSVWDSSSSITQDHEAVSKKTIGQSAGHTTASTVQQHSQESRSMEADLRSLATEELVKQRQNVAMELLWVQQAIISRKKYLKLKTQMDLAA